MSQWELALLLVALALVLLTGRRALPALLLRIRPGMLRCWFLESEQEAKVLEGSPALVDSLERLKRLRYFLLGVKVEKLPLWGPEYREVALAARDHSAFASIVLLTYGAPASTYLYTPLRGGGMVFTRDYAGGSQVDDELFSVRSIPTEDLERLAGAHHERVEDMRRRGAVLEVRATQAGRQAATRAFYASSYFRKTNMPSLLPALLTFSASVALLLWAICAPFLD
jgi:hypothetical protein